MPQAAPIIQGVIFTENRMTQFPIEAYTTVFDYLKHIASLCTGSILLITASLEKLFVDPEWKWLIAISLISFFLCVVATLAAQAGVIETIDKDETIGEWAYPLIGISLLIVCVTFLGGLLSVLIFALKNLF